MEIVNFLTQYWQYISIGLVVLLEIILMFVKKRPNSVDEFFATIYTIVTDYLPGFIIRAEMSGKTGQDKNTYVMNSCSEILTKLLGRDTSDKEFDYAMDIFEKAIEAILLCPTKKGGLGREQIEQKSK